MGLCPFCSPRQHWLENAPTCHHIQTTTSLAGRSVGGDRWQLLGRTSSTGQASLGCPCLHGPCLAMTSSLTLSSFSSHFSGPPIGDFLVVVMPWTLSSSGSCLGL